METSAIESVWFEQGGKATVASYPEIPQAHVAFLKRALPYFTLQNKLFVHAGIDPHKPLEAQSLQTLLWDRNLARMALDLHAKAIPGKLTSFDEVYLGHTPVPFPKPIQCCEIWLMDTGAGWSGCLSMMNIETKEVFSSDPVPALYPGVEGRKRK
jgi:serine/threonine protein phosphatase 1